MEKLTFVNRNGEIIEMTEATVVDMLVEWALSGEELSTEDKACIANAKSTFEGSFKLRELVFAAMKQVELGSDAWKRLFKIA